jgi:hypothetical protein
VPQNFFQAEDFTAVEEVVFGKRVTECMRRTTDRGKPCFPAVAAQQLLDTALRERNTFIAEKKLRDLLGQRLWSAGADILPERFLNQAADGYDPLPRFSRFYLR